MTDALILSGLLITAVLLWVSVISIRFLRSGRKAFDRYLDLTDPNFPVPPMAPGGATTTPPGHRRTTTWGQK